MKKNRKTILITSCILVCVLVFVILEVTNVTHFFHDKPNPEKSKTPTTGSTASFTDKGSTQKPTTSPSSSGSSNNSKDTGNEGAATLLTPSGNFISAHKVPASAPLASVCNTTPGATCRIVLTQNGTQRTLPAQIVDAGGSTYWNSWTPESLGINSGSWTIEAIVTLNGQEKRAQDAMSLEIQ